jgi:hypothetical protein
LRFATPFLATVPKKRQQIQGASHGGRGKKCPFIGKADDFILCYFMAHEMLILTGNGNLGGVVRQAFWFDRGD